MKKLVMLVLAAFAVSLVSCTSCPPCKRHDKKPSKKSAQHKGWGGRYRGPSRVVPPKARVRVRKSSDRQLRMKAWMKKRQESKKK